MGWWHESCSGPHVSCTSQGSGPHLKGEKTVEFVPFMRRGTHLPLFSPVTFHYWKRWWVPLSPQDALFSWRVSLEPSWLDMAWLLHDQFLACIHRHARPDHHHFLSFLFHSCLGHLKQSFYFQQIKRISIFFYKINKGLLNVCLNCFFFKKRNLILLVE